MFNQTLVKIIERNTGRSKPKSFNRMRSYFRYGVLNYKFESVSYLNRFFQPYSLYDEYDDVYSFIDLITQTVRASYKNININ